MMKRTMTTRSRAFKTFMFLVAALHLTACSTDEQKPKKDKEITTLRLHLESNAYSPDRNPR